MNTSAQITGNLWRSNSIGSTSRVHIAENELVTRCGRAIHAAGTHLKTVAVGEVCIDCMRIVFMRHVESGDIKL